jgi:hypothetical protein
MATNDRRQQGQQQDETQIRQMDSEGGRQHQGENSNKQGASGSQRNDADLRSSQRSDRDVHEQVDDSPTPKMKPKASESDGESCGCGS